MNVLQTIFIAVLAAIAAGLPVGMICYHQGQRKVLKEALKHGYARKYSDGEILLESEDWIEHHYATQLYPEWRERFEVEAIEAGVAEYTDPANKTGFRWRAFQTGRERRAIKKHMAHMMDMLDAMNRDAKEKS